MMAEDINSWLNQKEIAFQVNDFMLIGGMFGLVILLFFFMAIRQRSRSHKRGLRLQRTLTAETKGIIVDIVTHQDRYETSSTTTCAYASFNGVYQAKATPLLMQKYKYQVGDEVDIIYNPNNPNENAFKQDMIDSLKDRGYKGIFDVIKLILIFLLGVFVILLVTGISK